MAKSTRKRPPPTVDEVFREAASEPGWPAKPRLDPNMSCLCCGAVPTYPDGRCERCHESEAL